MWIEIDSTLINFDQVQWVRPHDYYPKTRSYILFIGQNEAESYHISYKSLMRKLVPGQIAHITNPIPG